MLPGGKGVNVSIVLRKPRPSSLPRARVPRGLHGRRRSRRRLRRVGRRGAISSRSPRAMSRINAKIKSADVETELNGQGPRIHAGGRRSALRQARRAQRAGDTLVISGSVPEYAARRHVRAHHGASRRPRRALSSSTPTRDLLTRTCCRITPSSSSRTTTSSARSSAWSSSTRDEVVPWARKLQERGAPSNVLVSMAGEGGGARCRQDGSVHESPAAARSLW